MQKDILEIKEQFSTAQMNRTTVAKNQEATHATGEHLREIEENLSKLTLQGKRDRDENTRLREENEGLQRMMAEKQHKKEQLKKRIQTMEKAAGNELSEPEITTSNTSSSASNTTNGNQYAVKYTKKMNPIISAFYPCTVLFQTETYRSADETFQTQKL